MIKGPKSKSPVRLTDQSNGGRRLSGCGGKQYRRFPGEIVRSLIRGENSTEKRNVCYKGLGSKAETMRSYRGCLNAVEDTGSWGGRNYQ